MEGVGRVLRAATVGGEDLQHARHYLRSLSLLEADALHLGREDDSAAALVMCAAFALPGDGFQHGWDNELAVRRKVAAGTIWAKVPSS